MVLLTSRDRSSCIKSLSTCSQFARLCLANKALVGGGVLLSAPHNGRTFRIYGGGLVRMGTRQSIPAGIQRLILQSKNNNIPGPLSGSLGR